MSGGSAARGAVERRRGRGRRRGSGGSCSNPEAKAVLRKHNRVVMLSNQCLKVEGPRRALRRQTAAVVESATAPV